MKWIRIGLLFVDCLGCEVDIGYRVSELSEKITVNLNLSEVVTGLAQIYLYIALTVKSFKDLYLPKKIYRE